MRSDVTALPLVTVIVPAFNYAHFISQTLDSVRGQTYQNWECVVVDDGSTDDTREVVARYVERDARIRYVHQQNSGLSAARNTGIKHSRGEFLQFLDADDLIEECKIEGQVEYLETHKDVDLVYGDARYFSTENPNERRYSMFDPDEAWMPQLSGTGFDLLPALLKQCILPINAPLVRRTVIAEVGMFNTKSVAVEDWEYWIRCASQGKRFQYVSLDRTLALIRYHPSSLSKNNARMVSGIIQMRQSVSKVINNAELVKYNRDLAAGFVGHSGIKSVQSGRLAEGIRYLMMASLMSRHWKERAKWLYCTLILPIAPRDQLENISTLPIAKSIRHILHSREIL